MRNSVAVWIAHYQCAPDRCRLFHLLPHGSILLFIRQRRELHHEREKSDRCLGYERVTSVQLEHTLEGMKKFGDSSIPFVWGIYVCEMSRIANTNGSG